MYADFFEGLGQFMIDAGIASHSTLWGCPGRQIGWIEASYSQVPTAYLAMLRVMGNGSGNLMKHEYGLGTDSSRRAREVATQLLADVQCTWRPSELFLPFCQHEGYTFLFFYLTDGDDPRVYSYLEGSSGPTVIAPTYTSWIREEALGHIERQPWNDEICREIGLHRDHWPERKRALDMLEAETRVLWGRLIERIAMEDASRSQITGPTEFQYRWVQEFGATELHEKFRLEGKRLPWGWVSSADADRA